MARCDAIIDQLYSLKEVRRCRQEQDGMNIGYAMSSFFTKPNNSIHSKAPSINSERTTATMESDPAILAQDLIDEVEEAIDDKETAFPKEWQSSQGGEVPRQRIDEREQRLTKLFDELEASNIWLGHMVNKLIEENSKLRNEAKEMMQEIQNNPNTIENNDI